jgi:hypothetical protein
VGRAETDDRLAENLGMRPDIPPHVLQNLIVKAAEIVRVRLLVAVPPDRQAAIQDMQARTDFLKLSMPTARRMLRFWLVRSAATAGD